MKSLRLAGILAFLAAIVLVPCAIHAQSTVSTQSADVATTMPADDNALPPPPPARPEIQFFDGSEWKGFETHSMMVEGAGATLAGTATATLKSKLDGPKTYAVLSGATSEVTLSSQKPRFRVATDRNGAFLVQLAQFESVDETRRTTFERVRKGAFFTKSIDLEAMEIREGLWELTPMKSLQPGEYALVYSEVDPAADFTVVSKGY